MSTCAKGDQMKTYLQTEISGREVLHVSLMPDSLAVFSALRSEKSFLQMFKDNNKQEAENGAKTAKNMPKVSNFRKYHRLLTLGTLPAQ